MAYERIEAPKGRMGASGDLEIVSAGSALLSQTPCSLWK